MPPLGSPLTDSAFKLGSAAVAAFFGGFGGKEAISSMDTIHFYTGRRWLGWYNAPGSYKRAERFGKMTKLRVSSRLCRLCKDNLLDVSLGLDGEKGPEYIAAFSGIKMPTGHLGYLTMERSKGIKDVVVEGRVMKPIYVAYLAMKHVDCNFVPVKKLPLSDAFFVLIPITISVVACVMCALIYDWFSFFLILLGIVCSGYTSLVIGEGKLVINFVKNLADGAAPGHRILKGEKDVVVIKGKEKDINVVTAGCFQLKMDPNQCHEVEEGDVDRYPAIGSCSLLFLAQFLAQILLIQQGHLFGQIMFIVSLVASWGYNSYQPSVLKKNKIQADLLFRRLGSPEMRRFRVGSQTTMAVFICLLLFHGTKSDLPKEEQRMARVNILSSCLPNNTIVWKRWVDMVVDQLLDIDLETRALPYLQDEKETALPAHDTPPQWNLLPLLEGDRKLLCVLLNDTAAAFRAYFDVYASLPVDSSQQPANKC